MNPQLEVNPAVHPEQQIRSVVEHPGAPPVVPQEEKDSLFPTQRQEAPKSQLLKEIQNCLEKLKKKRDEKMTKAGLPDSEVKTLVIFLFDVSRNHFIQNQITCNK